MSKRQTFKAIIEDAGGGGVYVTVPFDVEKEFGKKRLKVKATINGEPNRGSVVRMGVPQHIFPVLKSIQEKLGKGNGDEITVEYRRRYRAQRDRNPIGYGRGSS